MSTEAWQEAPVEALIAQRRPGFSSLQLAQALDALLTRERRMSGSAALTAHDQAFWDQHSGIVDDADSQSTALASNAAAAAVQEATSLTDQQVAGIIGRAASTVRHYGASKRLFTFKSNGRTLYPSWQFTEDAAIPHLQPILSAIPDDLHPQAVHGFFTTPQPDLILGGSAVSPKIWLVSGGPPDPVKALATSLAFTL